MKDSENKMNKLLEESNKWGPGKRNQEPMRKVSKEEGERILEKGGLELITIRLPSETIAKLKAMAEKDGIKYQPYLRKVLIQHTRNESSSLEARVERIENFMAEFKQKTGT